MDEEKQLLAYQVACGFERPDDTKKREGALERAHDLRKFEIDLLWKRSAYFWGLQVAAFAGLGAIGSGIAKGCENCDSTLSLVNPALLVLIALFGFVTAIGWLGVAQASKVYMVNWEKHIDFLEGEFTGHLYKTLFFRGNPDSAGPRLSITGINESIILVASILWAVMTLGAIVILCVKTGLTFLPLLLIFLSVAASIAIVWNRIFGRVISRPDDFRPIGERLPHPNGRFWQRRP